MAWHEDTRGRFPSSSKQLGAALCFKAGCEFYGNVAWEGYCSKCFKEVSLKSRPQSSYEELLSTPIPELVSAKVLFEYEAKEPDELTLVVGQVINNVHQQDGGWWEGEINGKRGLFPKNFVEVIIDKIFPLQPSTPFNAKIASTVKKARVAFEYDPEQDDELALKVGEIVEILEDNDEGWWKGRLNGKVGVFPSNYVEVIKEETKSPLPASSTITPPLPTSPPALLPQPPASTDTDMTGMDAKVVNILKAKVASEWKIFARGTGFYDVDAVVEQIDHDVDIGSFHAKWCKF